MHMQKSLGKKVLSGLLALGLCVSMVPAVPMTTYAADTGLSLRLDGADAAAWNGEDKVRVYVDAAESGAAIDTASYQITQGGGKYTLSDDGYLTLKPGKTAVKGDQITIVASAKYYSEEQLLWSDGLEVDGSLQPSQQGMYGLTHTDARAHNGRKSGTTNSAQCKDGMWSEDVNSTGRLVFWYYDPATAEELDANIITDDFDQIKFGMTINAYSDFLMGVGIPSSSETDDKAKYLKTYTVRENGEWKPTNIQRTLGWHKMEAEVTAEGTKAFIDGQAVCYAGEESPLLVEGVTTIAKAAVATNWADKSDVVRWVEGKHFIDDMYILKPDAGEIKTDDSLTMTVTVDNDVTEESNEMKLTFGSDNSGHLAKGESGKVYLDDADNVAIDSVEYTTNNENVIVGKDGTLTLKEGYKPAEYETVKVTAKVKYYDGEGVVFTDSFEGEKQFKDADSGVYKHSDKGSLFGRYAATATTSTNGSPTKNLDEVTNVTVTAYYYDANGSADQTKWGFSINNNDDAALGIFYDGNIAPFVNNMTKTHYGTRVKGYEYNDYGWGTTDVERTADWHKFQWVIDETKGLTMLIDGKVISTNPVVGKTSTDMNLVKVENSENIKSLNRLVIRNNWNNNGTNLSEIGDRHFIDGVSVVKNGTEMKETVLESVEIPVVGVQYTVTPASLTVDKTYPKDQTIYISPYMEGETDIVDVLVNGMLISEKLWTAGEGKAPQNATQYPAEMKGYRVVLDSAAVKEMAVGDTEIVLVTKEGTQIKVPVTVEATEHVATNYYLSNNGNDNNDGHTPDTAWNTFEKLQSVTFGPGDHIYLDAESTWNDVQFRPEGSGAEGKPIVLTKYNDGGDSSKRPVLNGNGTIADLNAHSYAAFDTWRAFYPSGTIELFNVEQWEVRGVEVTNYAKEMQKGATGRNGIAVIHDYMEVQDISVGDAVKLSNAEREQAFYRAGKLQHVVIEDCYIHDVVGYHPINGAVGRGGKMSGGINAYGPYDDLHMDKNIVMYCDVEGIRNDVLAWMGDTRTQFPSYMEDVTANNNFIVGVPGDGIVLSSANQCEIENNYLSDAGYSYYATSNSKNHNIAWSAGSGVQNGCRDVGTKTGAEAKDMGNRQAPMTMGSTNFAGLWFIGTKDSVAQYNEAVNNVWVCNDSEAFDADMFCWGTVFQYNYTYRNNGGFLLIMSTADDGTLVRYNVSVEDSQGYGLVGGESQNGLFHYSGAPDAIYNNLFILGEDVSTVFGGPANTTHFYNNIMIAPNGLLKKGAHAEDGYDYKYDFHINGSSDGTVKNPQLSGEMYNNLFTEGILDTIVDGSTVELKDNVEVSVEDLDKIFVDLAGFMEAQPVKALNGRSDITGVDVEELEYKKGVGVAFTPERGKAVKVPTGGFDLTQFEGIKLKENGLLSKNPAVGAGIDVDEMVVAMREKKGDNYYSYKEQTDAVLPLTEDFFKNDITALKSVDIGPFQSNAESHGHGMEKIDAKAATCTENGVKEHYKCTGCEKYFWDREGTQPIEDIQETVIPAAHKMTEVEAKDATCTEIGWSAYYTCAQCGKLYADEAGNTEVSLKDVIILPSHTDADGDGVCDDCSKPVNPTPEPTPDCGHEGLVEIEATEPTCTETGNKAFWFCPDCGRAYADAEGTEELTIGELIEGGYIIEATGHTESDKWVYDAENHWKVCADCEQPILESKAAHADVDEDGICDICGYKEGGEVTPTPKPNPDEGGNGGAGNNNSGNNGSGTNKPAQTTTVKTGDTTNVILWAVIVAVAGVAVIAMGVIRMKNTRGGRRR